MLRCPFVLAHQVLDPLIKELTDLPERAACLGLG